METKVELKAIGKNGSGKTILLKRLKTFLENEKLSANLSSEDEHRLVVEGNVCGL